MKEKKIVDWNGILKKKKIDLENVGDVALS